VTIATDMRNEEQESHTQTFFKIKIFGAISINDVDVPSPKSFSKRY